MNKKKTLVIVAVAAIAALAVWLLSGGKKEEKITFDTAAVAPANIMNSITATGTIEPVTSVTVGTQVSGIVSKLFVDYNSVVKKGQVIAELDKTNLMSQLNTAKTQLATAQSQLNYQTANYKRYKTLFEKGLVAADDFNIRSQEELASMMNSTTDMMTILLDCVAGISLIVGGIGIMNIMYVSVTERTREIGLRMSVGARGVDILSQFLIEAILLSITGGLIGVGLGIGASYAVKLLAHWPIYIQPWSIIMSFAVCTFTGVFFGWYPAKKAAQLDPIEAIRYE